MFIVYSNSSALPSTAASPPPLPPPCDFCVSDQLTSLLSQVHKREGKKKTEIKESRELVLVTWFVVCFDSFISYHCRFSLLILENERRESGRAKMGKKLKIYNDNGVKKDDYVCGVRK